MQQSHWSIKSDIFFYFLVYSHRGLVEHDLNLNPQTLCICTSRELICAFTSTPCVVQSLSFQASTLLVLSNLHFFLIFVTCCLASSRTSTHVAQVTAPQRLYCFWWLNGFCNLELSVCLRLCLLGACIQVRHCPSPCLQEQGTSVSSVGNDEGERSAVTELRQPKNKILQM